METTALGVSVVPPSPANPLTGLQSCLQLDMPLNLLITSSVVCLWKRSLPPGERPSGCGVRVRWEPRRVATPWLCPGIGIPGKQGAQGWHTGTPQGVSPAVSLDGPQEEADTGSRQRSRAQQGWALCLHTPDAGDAGAGAEVAVSGTSRCRCFHGKHPA